MRVIGIAVCVLRNDRDGLLVFHPANLPRLAACDNLSPAVSCGRPLFTQAPMLGYLLNTIAQETREGRHAGSSRKARAGRIGRSFPAYLRDGGQRPGTRPGFQHHTGGRDPCTENESASERFYS